MFAEGSDGDCDVVGFTACVDGGAFGVEGAAGPCVWAARGAGDRQRVCGWPAARSGAQDWRLYLPEGWAQDHARREKTQIPDGIGFATKPHIARELIGAALDAGVPCAFVLADALYGSDSRLRRMLEDRGQAYVLVVRSNHVLRFWNENGLVQTDPENLANALPVGSWATYAAGEGAKGLRLYGLGADCLALDRQAGLGALAFDPPQPPRSE